MHFAARYGALSILFCVLARPACSEPTVKNILPPFGYSMFCAQYPRDCDPTRRENISGVPLAGRLRPLNLVQLCLERIVGVNGEVRGDDGEIGAGVQVRPQVISDGTAKVVIANSGPGLRICHNLARMMPERASEFKPIDSANPKRHLDGNKANDVCFNG